MRAQVASQAATTNAVDAIRYPLPPSVGNVALESPQVPKTGPPPQAWVVPSSASILPSSHEYWDSKPPPSYALAPLSSRRLLMFETGSACVHNVQDVQCTSCLCHGAYCGGNSGDTCFKCSGSAVNASSNNGQGCSACNPAYPIMDNGMCYQWYGFYVAADVCSCALTL